MIETDARDRVLDHALSEIFHPVPEVDLSDRIRSAWEAGMRGSDLAGLAASAPVRLGTPSPLSPSPWSSAMPRARKIRPRGPARWLVAASIAALGAGALTWALWPRATERTRLAFPSRPLRVLRDGVETAAGELRAGDLLWIDPGVAGEVRFDSGLRLAAEPGTLVRIDGAHDRPSIELIYGTLAIDGAGGRGAELATALARIDLDPGARLRLRAIFERPGGALAAPDPLLVLAESQARAPADPAYCTFELESGGARLARARSAQRRDSDAQPREAEPTEALVVGSARTLVARPGAAGAVDLVDLAPLRRLLEALASTPSAPWTPMQREREYVERLRAEELARRELAAEPSAWLVLETEIRARFEKSAEKRAGELGFGFHLLNVAALDRSRVAVRIARELWTAHPESFSEEHIVAFAELGVPELELETESWVALCGTPGVPPPVLASVYQLGRGDPRARACLAEALQDPLLFEKKEDLALLAAAALDRAGDPGPWRDTIAALARQVEVLLARDELLLAGRVALTGELFELERRRAEPLRVGLRMRRIEEHVERRVGAVQTREEIRALVASLADG